MKVRPPHLRVIPGGRYRLHEIPRSLAGRPSLPQQIREHSIGLLGKAGAWCAVGLFFVVLPAIGCVYQRLFERDP